MSGQVWRWTGSALVEEKDLRTAKTRRGWVWVALDDPTDAEMHDTLAALGVKHDDAKLPHRNDRPRVELRADHAHVQFTAVRWKEHRHDVRRYPIAAIITERAVVTVNMSAEADPDEAADRYDLSSVLDHGHCPLLLPHGPVGLLYLVLDSVVEGYYTVSAHVEDVIEDVLDQAFEGVDTTRKQFHLRRQVVQFRRAAAPLRTVISVLARLGEPLVPRDLLPFFIDLENRMDLCTEQLDLDRESLVAAHEIAESRIMKKTSSWGAILLVPTLIAGIYGMNFAHMPELPLKFGYGFALVLIVGSMGVLYVFFKKKGYL